jgi:hypothetical protein
MQQPADFFCKDILPEHHRLEDPFLFCSRSPKQRHDVENVASAGALAVRKHPAARTNLACKH